MNAERHRRHRLWAAENRRHAPPCRRCALPLAFSYVRDQWWCSCGHIVNHEVVYGICVLKSTVRYRWRWLLWRWAGIA